MLYCHFDGGIIYLCLDDLYAYVSSGFIKAKISGEITCYSQGKSRLSRKSRLNLFCHSCDQVRVCLGRTTNRLYHEAIFNGECSHCGTYLSGYIHDLYREKRLQIETENSISKEINREIIPLENSSDIEIALLETEIEIEIEINNSIVIYNQRTKSVKALGDENEKSKIEVKQDSESFQNIYAAWKTPKKPFKTKKT